MEKLTHVQYVYSVVSDIHKSESAYIAQLSKVVEVIREVARIDCTVAESEDMDVSIESLEDILDISEGFLVSLTRCLKTMAYGKQVKLGRSLNMLSHSFEHYESFFDTAVKCSLLLQDAAARYPQIISTVSECSDFPRNTTLEKMFLLPARHIKSYSKYLDAIAKLDSDARAMGLKEMCDQGIWNTVSEDVDVLSGQIDALIKTSIEVGRSRSIIASIKGAPFELSPLKDGSDGSILRAASFTIRVQGEEDSEPENFYAIGTKKAILLTKPSESRGALIVEHVIDTKGLVLKQVESSLSFQLANSGGDSSSSFEVFSAHFQQKDQWMSFFNDIKVPIETLSEPLLIDA